MAKAILVTNLCLWQLLFLFKVSLVMSQEVLLHPYSRLVPAGTDVHFTCKLRGAQNPHWIVGRVEANDIIHKKELSAMGIYILDDEQSNRITTLTLRINSSYSTVNNTQISCTADGIRSETAKLLIIDHSPLSQNPSLRQINSTALSLQWSSPYIWPGYSIGFYNVSVRSHDNDHVMYHLINAEFDDKIVDFAFVEQKQQTNNCSEFTFGISAVGTDSHELPMTYVTGGYASDLQGVNFRVVALFRADGVPVLLQVQIEVFYHPLDPMLTNNDNYFTINLWIPELICDFQELNYSVFIEDADRNILTLLGPIHHRGSGNLHHNIIVSSLEKGQDYVARMYAESTLDNTTSSYSFGTNLEATNVVVSEATDTLIYKIALGISSFILIVTLTTFFICMCICCARKRREKPSTDRIVRMLVTNPIYDGPVYESVFPHFETVTANTQQNNIEPPETESSDHTFSAPSTPDTTQSNSARYVDNPLQLSDHCIDSPSTVTATESEQFTSVVSDNQKAMFTSNHSETQVTINYAAASEETYTVMNPAGTLTLSL